jgi:hypothetical protein
MIVGIGSPIIVPPGSGSAADAGTMPTLSDFYVALAKQLGVYAYGGVSATVPSGEPGRWVILDEMRDDEEDRAAFAGGWISVKSGTQAGTQRRIRKEGYEGPFGALALARVLPSNLDPATVVEVTNPLPVRSVGMMPGLVDFVNQGLERVWVEVRLPLVGNATRRTSLQGYPWLTERRQTDGIYDRRYRSGSDPTAESSAEYDVTVDGPTVTLETATAYNTGEPFQLAAFVQASRLTYDGSAWGYARDGLVNDTDRAAISVGLLRPIAMALALDYLITYTAADRALADAERTHRIAEYTRRLQTRWGPAAQEVITKRLPRPSNDPPRRTVAVTSGRGRRWP